MAIQQEHEIPYSSELLRKGIHVISLSIPIVYYYIPQSTALLILTPLAVISVVLDMGRYYLPGLGKLYYSIFRHMLRPHELDESRKLLNGASWVLISAVLCVMIFPKLITVTAFSVLIVSDTMAALVGRRFGKNKFFQKSLEGAIAFFVSALVVIAVIPDLPHDAIVYTIAIVSALVATIIESASIALHVDDNLSIPLSMGGTMWALLYLIAVAQPDRYAAIYAAITGWR